MCTLYAYPELLWLEVWCAVLGDVFQVVMLRVVSPGELETCHCVAVGFLVYIPGEDYPRCFECLRPVREYCKLDNCGRWAYLVWSLMVARALRTGLRSRLGLL